MLELRVKNWDLYQPRKDQPSWIKLHTSLLYDAQFQALPRSAQWILVRVWLSAAPVHGTINLGTSDVHAAYTRCTSAIHEPNTSRTHAAFKLLIDKGFLILASSLKEGEREGGREIATATAPSPVGEPPRLRRQRPSRTSQAVAVSPPANGEGNWIGPVLEEWQRQHGGAAPARVRGLLLTGLSPRYQAGQTPAQMAERFGIWLAATPAAKHRYVEDFTSCYGDYEPSKCDDPTYLLNLIDRSNGNASSGAGQHT